MITSSKVSTLAMFADSSTFVILAAESIGCEGVEQPAEQ